MMIRFQRFLTPRPHSQGFGLIVIAALFTAFAVVAAAMLERNSALNEINQQQAARTQLSRLSDALVKYAAANSSRFPCPANYTLGFNDINFGNPATTTCYTGSAPSGTVFLSGTATANKLIQGMVPVRALIPYGIALNDAFDPWGSRIMVTVHRDMTYGAPATTILNLDRPAITDYVTGEAVAPPPDLLLLSYGKDRAGGRLRSQTASLASPAIACPTSTQRNGINCTATRTYIMGPLSMNGASSAANYFDDIVSMLRLSATSGSSGTPCAANAGYNWVGGTSPAAYNAASNCTAALAAMNDGQSQTLTHCLANGSPGAQTGRTGAITVTCTNGTLSKPSGSTGQCLRSNCFLHQVPVLLADGTSIPIDQLKPGDKVRGKNGINTVIQVPVVHDDRPVYGFNGGEKFVTAGHPFFTQDGWKSIDPTQTPVEGHGIEVKKLAVGDRITMSDGTALTITSIDRGELGENNLYNPVVSGDHTYFANGLLVHNKIGDITC